MAYSKYIKTTGKQYVLESLSCLLYIQMELCSGMDLKKWMEKTRIRNRNDIKEMMAGILNALVYIHSKNYIHRDLKVSK